MIWKHLNVYLAVLLATMATWFGLFMISRVLAPVMVDPERVSFGVWAVLLVTIQSALVAALVMVWQREDEKLAKADAEKSVNLGEVLVALDDVVSVVFHDRHRGTAEKEFLNNAHETLQSAASLLLR